MNAIQEKALRKAKLLESAQRLANQPAPAPWDPAEARRLADQAQAVGWVDDNGRQVIGWSADPALGARQFAAAEAVDAAWCAQDLAALRTAVAAFLALFPADEGPTLTAEDAAILAACAQGPADAVALQVLGRPDGTLVAVDLLRWQKAVAEITARNDERAASPETAAPAAAGKRQKASAGLFPGE